VASFNPILPQYMKINVYTAKPVFELMLAADEREVPYREPAKVWDIFLKFLAIPANAAEDAGCFQTTYLEPVDNDREPTIFVGFARQLGDAKGWRRSVQLQYTLGSLYAGRLPDVDVWTNEFESLDAFARHVEALPHFKVLCEDDAPTGELFVEEL
jgi:hypothetical protein